MAKARQTLIVGGGRYKLKRKLGTGQFGEVWLATDLDENDAVAVKLFDPAVRPDKVLIEAALQRRLSLLPRTVGLRNVDVRSGAAPILAMDYMPNGSVGDRVKAGTVSLVEAVRWTRDALEGLAGAHAVGIIHRDLKPNNLLLDGAGHAVLSDFGISEDTVRKMNASNVMYAPLIPPERLTGVGTSKQSDIYAAGCLLYHLLTNDYPYQDPTAAAAGGAPRADRLNAQVPMAVSRVIEKALSADPSDRYRDAAGMLDALSAQDVVESWTPSREPGFIEVWETNTRHGSYRLTIQQRTRDFEIKASAGAGHRLLRARRETKPSLAQTQQVARKWLRHVVGGGKL